MTKKNQKRLEAKLGVSGVLQVRALCVCVCVCVHLCVLGARTCVRDAGPGLRRVRVSGGAQSGKARVQLCVQRERERERSSEYQWLFPRSLYSAKNMKSNKNLRRFPRLEIDLKI